MSSFTVQVLYPLYYSHICTVDAETLDAACAKAIEESGASDQWKALDDCGPSFVISAAPGQDEATWKGAQSVLAVPFKYSEAAQHIPFTKTEIEALLLAGAAMRDADHLSDAMATQAGADKFFAALDSALTKLEEATS